MSKPYLAENSKELFESASQGIKKLIKGGQVLSAATVLAQQYKIPIGLYQRFANVISFTLIGAIQPNNVVIALIDGLELSQEEATSLAQDLENGIFAEARAVTLGKPVEEGTKLEFSGERSPDELRKEIMDTTKRESALRKPQGSGILKKGLTITPGSRSQLLEQLQILSTIPNDEEVEARLSHIQEQINSIKKTEAGNTLESKIALKSFMFGEQGKETVPAILKTSTYSVPPTRYNLDPYREVSEG